MERDLSSTPASGVMACTKGRAGDQFKDSSSTKKEIWNFWSHCKDLTQWVWVGEQNANGNTTDEYIKGITES